MSVSVAGFVKNGVVVPHVPLPEGAAVEIRLRPASGDSPAPGNLLAAQATSCPAGSSLGESQTTAARLTPTELRRMPREQRHAILAAAAAIAEYDYISDKDLTGFEAYAEEALNDDESHAGLGAKYGGADQ